MSIKTAKIKYDIPTISEIAKKTKKVNPNAINGTLGTFFYDDTEFKAYKTVKNVINNLDDADYFNYAPTTGGPEFEASSIKWVFKDRVEKIKSITSVRSVAAAGGTGTLLLSMLECLKPGEEILIADLCWEPYITMCTVNNFVAARYNMFDENLRFNIKEFKQKCKKMLDTQDSITVLVNDPCNNPTGYSLTMDEFKEMTSFFDNLDQPVNILYDIAYADYCGDQEEVLDKLEILANLNPKVRTFICFSASKTFCVYGVRLGAQLIMSKDSEAVDRLYKRSAILCRTHWSNTSNAGIHMFNKLVNDETLKEEFLKELHVCQKMLLDRIHLFLQEAKECGLSVYDCNGGFFVSVPTTNPPFVYEKLREQDIFLIPLETSIRVAICSIPINEVKGLAKKIKDAIDLIPDEE